MTEIQEQVVIGSILGDGCLVTSVKKETQYIQISNINKDYIQLKETLLGDLVSSVHYDKSNTGSYAANPKSIHVILSKRFPNMGLNTLQSVLDRVKLLGMAIWFYDDGSLHKNKGFMNLNTQAFTKEQHEQILQPWFSSKGIETRIRQEKRKSGATYYYLYIPRYEVEDKIVPVMKLIDVPSLRYKIWSSETIPRRK